MTDLSHLPDRALSIMQPWAWLIVNGHKDIENRDWPTKFRGLVCIHAGKNADRMAALDVLDDRHPVTGEHRMFSERMAEEPARRGGIVGVAEIVDCVSASPSEWFVGRFGFIIRNARPIDFIPVKGALGFFEWKGRLL
ncbi:ASCH domain-containing protein [Mesorhizobium sp.]|uniref:ASCH domain-containing protein n=1 Tax=Mesorhizobium sp. TaxID=1871066 RepID=UPI00122A8F4A|nr:ASCH domain-containing protein [Mesorhizobium sp.]TIN82216.1 MAG: ASCH domain-containing protein [Mesorhizobium sp.]